MSKNILIQLQPIDYYFFGGEETFNSGAKGITNYYVKSNKLPQQTGLLGCIRHALFEGGYPIGDSFDGKNQNYGFISTISPLFLRTKEGEILLPAPSNINHLEATIDVSLTTGGKSFFNGIWKDNNIDASGYEAKEGNGNYWINISTGKLVSPNNLFSSKDHIGINKGKQLQNKAAEGGFYKQEFITLQEGLSFAVVAQLDEKVEINNLPPQLTFGGEKRTFNLTYTNTEMSWVLLKHMAFDVFRIHSGSTCCLMLLTDTFIEKIDVLYQTIDYGIINETPFRNIITPKTVTNFSRLSRQLKEDSLLKTIKGTYLFKKGSVFYFNREKATEIKELISNPIFESVGYNHYFIFNN